MIAYWDGSFLHLKRSAEEEEARIPLVPGNGVWEALAGELPQPPRMLLLPLEHCLQQPFRLPLRHPRFLDAQILGQELNDQSGEDPEAWWLTWHAVAVEDGVEGVLFGLPVVGKEALSSLPQWELCQFVGVDGCLRLAHWLPEEEIGPCAVVDADQQGIFVGFYEAGNWRGIRRINRLPKKGLDDLAEDMFRTLSSMGFAAEQHPVYGRVDKDLLTFVEGKMPQWRGRVCESLPDRGHATLSLACNKTRRLGPNFRHGQWSPSSQWRRSLAPWRRAIALALVLVFALIGRDLLLLRDLQQREHELQAGIEAAFHRGLPQERVMLDPIAQLRASAEGIQQGDPWLLLRQLESIGAVKRRFQNLEIRAIELSDEGMVLSGVAASLSEAARIRDALGQVLHRQVRLQDTELSGSKARFRLKWS